MILVALLFGLAMNDAARFVGGTLGMAAMGSMYASVYGSRLTATMPASLPGWVAVIAHQQRSKALTSHGHASGYASAPGISNHATSSGRTDVVSQQPPRDPSHRSRVRRWSPVVPRESDAMALQLHAPGRGSGRWTCRL